MDIKQIESLARIMTKNGLSALEVSEGELKISMKKDTAIPAYAAVTPSVPLTSAEAQPSVREEEVRSEVKEKAEKGGYSFSGLKEVSSPIAGVFYSAPSPDSPPFVKVGDKVKKGDVLCIIEAMKLMNELTAETDGEIAEVCVKNEQIVEYGQTLFTIF